MDLALTLWINGFAGQWAVLDAVGRFAAVALLFVLAAGAFCVLVVVPHGVRRRAALALVSAAIVAYGVSQLIGIVAFRPRPFVTHPEVRQLIAKAATEKSFPSGHATVAFALATSVSLMIPFGTRRRRWIRFAMYALALGIAVGRVYVGVHYVSDMLAGAFLGTGCAWLVARALRRYSYNNGIQKPHA
ncbi:phosphatase PAP2 family protein [Candidatus Uhrbacteria bacterium]|nr:phosphatase PAP2 family protein [Candidatus Uhrbacteria bacterium]